MGIVGGKRREPIPGSGQGVGEEPAIAALAVERVAFVVNLDAIEPGRDPQTVAMHDAIPHRVRNRDVGTGLRQSLHKVDVDLIRAGRMEIGRKADRQQVPPDAVLKTRHVHLGREQGREIARPERRGIGDREAIVGQEMIGNGDEVVSALPIGLDDFTWTQQTIRARAVTVDVSAKVLTGFVEREVAHAK